MTNFQIQMTNQIQNPNYQIKLIKISASNYSITQLLYEIFTKKNFLAYKNIITVTQNKVSW